MLDLSQFVEKAEWYHLLAGLGICWLMLFVQNCRWWVLLRNSASHLSLLQTFQLTLVGQFFSYALPGGVGGDVVKGYYLVKKLEQGKMNPLMSLLMDRLVGFWAMSFLALLGIALGWEKVSTNTDFFYLSLAVFSVFLGFSLFFVISIFVPIQFFRNRMGKIGETKIGGFFLRVLGSIQSYGEQPSSLLKAFILSLCSQSLAVIFMFSAAWVFGYEGLGWNMFFFAVPLGFISMALPIAPAGIGVGQASLFFLFQLWLGRETTVGPTVMTAFQMSLFIASLPGGYFYLRMKPNLQEPQYAG